MPAEPGTPHPDIADVALTDVLFALSDPARLQIVRDLADGPLEMAECGATNPALPKSTKSHLMKVLREAGVIRNEPRGRDGCVAAARGARRGVPRPARQRARRIRQAARLTRPRRHTRVGAGWAAGVRGDGDPPDL